MRRTITLPAVLVLATLALAGCSAAGSASDSSGSSGGGVAAPQSQEFASDGSTSDQPATDSDTGYADRQVITTGYVTITVEDPMDTASDAVRITEQAGGRVDGRTEYAPKDDTDKGSATLTLRIPSASLTATLDKLRDLGTVEEVSLSAQDVTMATQDLDARISSLTKSIATLENILVTTTDVDALITLESAISDRQATLESLQSERRYYADQVSLSTITLNLVAEYNAPVEEPNTFITGLVAGWNAFVAFFAGLLVVLGVLLPWLVFAGIVTFAILWIVRWNRRRKAAS